MTDDSLMIRQKFLNSEDFSHLFTFSEQVDDPDSGGYSTSKEVVKRLAELGVVQSFGFGRYGVTSFGHWLIATEFEQSPKLPLCTASEYNSRKLT
jgi:hypothetical protein